MPLAAGTRLGAYEITSLIGVGGMGEVYKARDTRLKRDVAVKVLPEAFSHDPDRLARFQREAEVLATLNHPNIAAIYGLEHADGMHAIIMELVEGPTLAQRLRLETGDSGLGRKSTQSPSDQPLAPSLQPQRGLPITEALTVARQVAEALQAAHDKVVMHRDLKPANIGFTLEGQVKVLDFGLAKAFETEARPDVTNSPTLSLAATKAGVILGTAAYMSPEQAKGRQADKRSDVWAFGAVLYEMLTGRRAFEGEDLGDTLASVIKTDPDWTALPAEVPPHIRMLLQRCLAKERRQRTPDISVALFIMTDPSVVGAQSSTAAAPRVHTESSLWRRLAVPAAAAALVGVVVGVAVWVATRPDPPRVSRLVIPTSGATALSLQGNTRDLAITPDGTRVLYRGTNQLLVRALDQLEPTSLRGLGDPRGVFVSPDGQWVGFFDGTSPLKKVAITGGPAVTLTPVDGNGQRGATWGEDGAIVFATNAATGLQRVSSAGGEPTVLTTPNRERGEGDHLWPEFLPGGQAVLVTITAATGGLDNAQVAVLDLGTGTSKTVLRGGHHAHYMPSGHLVFGATGTLRAVPFDLGRREVTGPPVPVLDAVATTPQGGVDVTVAANGTLVYVPGGGVTGAQRSLVWVDRTGREEPLKAAPVRAYVYPRISPDGTRVALDIRDQENDIWIWDVARQALMRLTIDPANDFYPVWTPDSRRIMFASQRTGQQNLYRQAADGTGAVERLTESANTQASTSMSPDGRSLVLAETVPQTSLDLLALSLAPGAPPTSVGVPRLPSQGFGQPSPLVQTRFAELNGEVSPDGHWLAYQSNKSGRDEIYVQPFPDVANGQWQVSTGGGRAPLWARSGRELFYRSADGQGAVMGVQVEPGPAWRNSPPTQVLPARYYDTSGTTGRTFDIAPDGRRFLMIKQGGGDETAPQNLIVVLNFFEELKRLVPRN